MANGTMVSEHSGIWGIEPYVGDSARPLWPLWLGNRSEYLHHSPFEYVDSILTRIRVSQSLHRVLSI